MTERSRQHHLLNGPTQAAVGETEGQEVQADRVTKQNQGRCRDLIEHISEGQESEETKQYLPPKKSGPEVKAMTSPFVEHLSAGAHSTTSSLFKSGQVYLHFCLPRHKETSLSHELSFTGSKQGRTDFVLFPITHSQR